MKNGEMKLSSVVFTIIIAIASIMMFAKLTIDFTHGYGKTELPEYKDYYSIYGNISTITEELAESQNDLTNDTITDLKWYQKISKATKEAYNVLSDNIIVKAMKTITIPVKLIGSVVNSINVSVENSAFEIPVYIKWTIIMLASISIIFVVIKAFWSRII